MESSGVPLSSAVGRASSGGITTGRLLYAKETKALGGCADLWLCEGEGNRVLAWLTRTIARPVTSRGLVSALPR